MSYDVVMVMQVRYGNTGAKMCGVIQVRTPAGEESALSVGDSCADRGMAGGAYARKIMKNKSEYSVS